MLEPDMTRMFELSVLKLKTTIIDIPSAIMDKVDRIQEQMSNVGRQVEILRKDQEEMLEIKNLTEMKNVFDGFSIPIGAWVYFWASYLVALIYISVFVPVPYCFDYCSFVI